MQYADPTTSTLKPAGPTMARFNEANARLNDVNEALDSLEDKLSLVLNNSLGHAGQQDKGVGTTAKPVPNVPIHGHIEDLAERLSATLTRVNDLASRITL